MAKVEFVRRETDAELNQVPIKDGQMLVSAEGTSYIDYGDNRIGIGGSADSDFNENSTNAIQNKTVTQAINKINEIFYNEEGDYELDEDYE